jgi:signal transduction histidine kinase/CheY-like chemotaxis protein
MLLGAFVLGAVALTAIGGERGAPGSLLPHGYCFTWNPTLLWTHVVSDGLIGAAYVSIPVTLVYLVRRRNDIPFDWIVLLFAVFIISCGATHWIEVLTVWQPDYWLSASVKVVTACASVLTAVTLVGLVPRILAIPTVAELTAAKEALESEVGQRRAAEAALILERTQLERRVLDRTQQLAEATRIAEAAHARAEQANSLKDRFLAKVSHELRTPLQSTMTWAQLLQRSPLDAAKATQASDRIMHNVRSQARLIDDLLDISRILSGKLRLELQSVDAAAVVDKAVEVVRSASASRGIQLEVVRDGNDASIDTDPVRLEQIIWNLVNNAVQASADGGRVRIRFGAKDSMFRFEVRDWGRGIDPSELGQIFEPFRQGPGGGSHRGLGLGLAIARSIADMFGGQLSAASDGPGQGATFTLLLPLVSSPVAEKPSGEAAELDAEERARLAGLRVLYVEDEPDIAEGGQLMLSGLGASVALCLDFDAASERVRAGGFDILLSDLNLGDGHTAFELLALLRSLPQGREVPALLLSAYGSAEDRARSHEAGFIAHFVKPAEATRVARALLEAMALVDGVGPYSSRP